MIYKIIIVNRVSFDRWMAALEMAIKGKVMLCDGSNQNSTLEDSD